MPLALHSASHLARERRRLVHEMSRVLLALALVLVAGCAMTRNPIVSLPTRNSVHADQLVVLSDFPIPDSSPLISDLKKLREEVHKTLGLPFGSRPVTVYLFADESVYSRYLKVTYPDLPDRRAYFIKKSPGDELAVYTSWGDRIQEDLRHEFTHGLLHASLKTPPLWLDEGLAEYFEVIGPTGSVNRSDVARLAASLDDGWRPDLPRLETLAKVDQMSRSDYREAWAWVHYMLHSSEDTRQVLLGYLKDLRTDRNPRPISVRLAELHPNVKERMVGHVATVYSTPTRAAAHNNP